MLTLRPLLLSILPLALLACAHHAADKPPILAPDNPDTMTVATADGRPAWMPPPSNNMGFASRVGIMTVLDNELLHVEHGVSTSTEVLKPGFDLAGYTGDALRRAMIDAKKPFLTLSVRPSARLFTDRAVWQKSWNEKNQSFDNNWQAEFDSIIKQNQLAMLIVISAPEVDGGIGNADLQGSGYYAQGLFGKHQTAAFSTLHFYRVRGLPGKLQMPVQGPGERLFAEIPNFPSATPVPFPKPMQDAVERELRKLIDQKAATVVTLLK